MDSYGLFNAVVVASPFGLGLIRSSFQSFCCVSSFYNRERNLNFGPFGLCTIRCFFFQTGNTFWDSFQGSGLFNKPNMR